jgi:hypothetical protein
MEQQKYNELFAALAKAQAGMQTAGMNSQNPFFKSRYADFTEIVRASRPSLTANGLCVIQRIITATDGMTLVTTLGHSSGQYIDSEMRISPAKSDVQSLGSYISYLKRYQYAAICGVLVSDEDDDGEAEMVRQESKIPEPKAPPSYAKITTEQIEQLEHELDGYPGIASNMLAAYKVKTLNELPKSNFLSIIERIRTNKAAGDK